MMMSSSEIYLGSRGKDFQRLVQGILAKGRLKSKYIQVLTDEENMKEYGKAFTAESADAKHNSEVFEQLGDLSLNKFIVWYMHRRFPILNNTMGVKVVARLRINYGSKQSFYKIAENLGFWPYISASVEERSKRMRPLMEDALEAFIGCTEYILDKHFRPGVGYAIVYDLLKSIFDSMPISLKYVDLYDAKTRLKELFDTYPKKLTKLKYSHVKDMNKKINTVTVSAIVDGRMQTLGTGSAALKSDAQQRAAEVVLNKLNSMNIYKNLDPLYVNISSDPGQAIQNK